MSAALQQALDSVLANTVASAGGVPGVVAMATDRNGTIYEGAAGVRQAGTDTAMTTDSIVFLASCTKAITGIAVMQLVEEGLIKLEDEAARYVPEIGQCQVLTGFDADGQPLLRAPVRPITVNHLMLHTSGLAYEFFSADEARYRQLKGVPTILACNADCIKSVLLFDPGEAWCYGSNIDWLGLIVEKFRGKRLGEVLRERLFGPLGMNDTSFELSPSMRSRLVTIHQRQPNGEIVAVPELVLPQPPVMDMGGHGLYGTTGDYLKFIRMILNDGNGTYGRVLKPETVAALAKNGLGALKTPGWTTSMPNLANSGDFFPGFSKSWSYSFQVNATPLPTGRPAGSLSWAGIANSFYWIDRQTGVGGMWNTQILPFLDVSSWPGYVNFETTVYQQLAR